MWGKIFLKVNRNRPVLLTRDDLFCGAKEDRTPDLPDVRRDALHFIYISNCKF